MTGVGDTACQLSGEPRLSVDCRVKPIAASGQDNFTLFPAECTRVSTGDGGMAGTRFGTMAVEPLGLMVNKPPLAGGSPESSVTTLPQYAGSGEQPLPPLPDWPLDGNGPLVVPKPAGMINGTPSSINVSVAGGEGLFVPTMLAGVTPNPRPASSPNSGWATKPRPSCVLTFTSKTAARVAAPHQH